MFSDRQAVEFFLLHFLRLLCTGPDKDRFGVKGGCNLRFFFESARYSEAIDLDVSRLPVHVLKEKVSKILGGPALALPLRSRGIALRGVTTPKQTETTQRWKVGLSVEGRELPLHTKIEFSRRTTSEPAITEAVAHGVLAEYGLMPILAPHYPLGAALRQKLGALIGRSAVQARDVFDLGVLLARAGTNVELLASIRDQAPKALERAMQVSYGAFKSQVVSYLKPEQAESLGSREAWDELQARVVAALEQAGQ